MQSPLQNRLEACLARSRAKRQREGCVDQPRRTSITIRNVDKPGWLATGSAVLIDRKRRGQLVRGTSRTFHVLPGNHRVLIRHRFGFVDSDIFHLEAGEEVALVCGRVNGRRWLRWKLRTYSCVVTLGFFVALYWGFVRFPGLHDSMISTLTSLTGHYEWVVFLFGVRGTLYLRLIGASLGMLLWGLINRQIMRNVFEPRNKNGELFFLRLAKGLGEDEETRPDREPGFRP